MNFTIAIFLVRKDIRAIAVSYEVDDKGQGKKPFYTFKSDDQSIVVGDYVVIPTGTRHDMTVARVEEVDVDIDFDSDIQFRWLVDKVDRTRHDAICIKESQAIAAIRSAETRRKREELADKLLADNPGLSDMLNVTGVGTLAAPPAPPGED